MPDISPRGEVIIKIIHQFLIGGTWPVSGSHIEKILVWDIKLLKFELKKWTQVHNRQDEWHWQYGVCGHLFLWHSCLLIEITRGDSQEYCKFALLIDIQSNNLKTKYLTFKCKNTIPNLRFSRAHALSVASLLCTMYLWLQSAAVYNRIPLRSFWELMQTDENTAHTRAKTLNWSY